MSYKLNRNCWVETADDALCEDDGLARTVLMHPSIKTRVDSAERIFQKKAIVLRANGKIRSLIDRSLAQIELSTKEMALLGIQAACARCDAESEVGSCCGRGLEEKYDVILLLANLLAGADIRLQSKDPASCLFLGSKGCRLAIRHMLCIDYLCPEIENNLGLEGLTRIQTVSGFEIESLFHLCEALKTVIRQP